MCNSGCWHLGDLGWEVQSLFIGTCTGSTSTPRGTWLDRFNWFFTLASALEEGWWLWTFQYVFCHNCGTRSDIWWVEYYGQNSGYNKYPSGVLSLSLIMLLSISSVSEPFPCKIFIWCLERFQVPFGLPFVQFSHHWTYLLGSKQRLMNDLNIAWISYFLLSISITSPYFRCAALPSCVRFVHSRIRDHGHHPQMGSEIYDLTPRNTSKWLWHPFLADRKPIFVNFKYLFLRTCLL